MLKSASNQVVFVGIRKILNTPSNVSSLVDLRDLRFGYGATDVLHGVTLNVPRG